MHTTSLALQHSFLADSQRMQNMMYTATATECSSQPGMLFFERISCEQLLQHDWHNIQHLLLLWLEDCPSASAHNMHNRRSTAASWMKPASGGCLTPPSSYASRVFSQKTWYATHTQSTCNAHATRMQPTCHPHASHTQVVTPAEMWVVHLTGLIGFVGIVAVFPVWIWWNCRRIVR